MSIVIAVAETRVVANPLPPAVARRLAAFLAGGHTGKIVLNVKGGEVRSCEVTEVVDARSPLDETFDPVPRSEH